VPRGSGGGDDVEVRPAVEIPLRLVRLDATRHGPTLWGMPLDGALSPLHWLIVAVVALVVLGPDQLPKLARQAGHAYSEFARVRAHVTSDLRDMVSEFDLGTADDPNNASNMLPPVDKPGVLTEDSE
jgi:TatA/E family protein of Tat protein translocase